MEKVTKKKLARKVKELEMFVDYADNLLTQLNHALPEPIEIKHWRDEQSDYDELIEILDSKEPKLKQLDQSVFDGLDEKWRFAAVDECGEVWCSTHKTQPSTSGTHLSHELKADSMQVNGYYDTTNWQNSLIERDKVELTGSDLCRAMLERGDNRIMCAPLSGYAMVITGFDGDTFVDSNGEKWNNAAPISNQGEPLTAADAGL